MASLKPYVQLTRPANLLTALADIVAGMAISGFLFSEYRFGLLLISTLGLYGGGVVLNDVFDAKLDAIERPERPIPSGKVPLRKAAFFGVSLLLIGIAAAALYSTLSGLIAFLIALLVILYDSLAKHSGLFGPLVMGMCRGGNLLLGMSVLPEAIFSNLWVTLLPIIYIGAITLISQDEVHGGKRRTLYLAGLFYSLVHAAQLWVAFQQNQLWLTVPWVLLHAYLVFRPLIAAINNPIGPKIGKAVKAGVLSLLVMNAAWCMAFGYIPLAICLLLLLPLSIQIARFFAVT
ncbi:UbiA-like protein EboC [Arundinibacter roseus]|uniref:Polyprenyltransferase n=1 Tax=Arundinibacter roseus TaxID=2070510 RepID=A0A4R4KCR2_9BACT|nr:UbiA-like protein EboC [Arundinibacter roseus]TDB64632.1 polyprenyltransferase [Arundinibacter roseus]